jgi:aromatic ring-opening dioxygenase LigB subunit
MIVFSAIIPHSAILLPNVGKQNLKKLNKTTEALEKIKQDFKNAKPDSVIIISSHAGTEKHFSLYINEKYYSDFETVGDFATKINFTPDFLTLAHLRKLLRIKGFPLALKSDEKLDYDFTIPLFYLLKKSDSENKKENTNPSIIPLETADLSPKKHFECGEAIKEEIVKSQKRIAVIASANLSHTIETDSPGGYSPAGKEFDKKLQEFIMNKNNAGLMLYDENKIKEAKECGVRQITMLMGILKDTNYAPKIYSYETPFGIGFMVANLQLPA